MLRRFIFSVGAILLCGACSSSGAGTHSGSVSLFGARHDFGDLDFTIEAIKVSDRPMAR